MAEALRFLHLLFVLWFAAGVGLTSGVLARGARSRDLSVVAFAFDLAGAAQKIFLIPGLLLLGLSGALSFIARPDTGASGWLVLSIVLTLLVLVADVAYLQPHLAETARTARAAMAEGRLTPRLAMLLQSRRRSLASYGMALLVLIILALMVFRPF